LGHVQANDQAGKTINVSAAFDWRIENAHDSLFAVENRDYFMRNQNEVTLRQVVGSHDLASWSLRDRG
jgi:regulator of protease activity HflC (stomatin/prohibitin superfamily)